ncbi:LacI family DNA-binding transcriptional regulator [Pseudonocardia sp.]|uniref:LacI family DNA-binding transcriptional regulator n=1 Tax=Pseudonocardia sp. TaxID=60912 RepID=UPI003D0D914B
MPADRPTIHTVAARAGVSKSLVSLVLRGSPKVSPDRRAAVQRAIAELGYRPNVAARDLRERRNRTVGALINDLRHPWLADLLDGLTEELAGQGRQLLLHGGRLDRVRDDAVPQTLADLGVDGLVLAGTQLSPPTLAEVTQIVPTVAVAWRDLDLPRVDTVGNDDLAGGALATRHLLDLGHRRIAHIAGHLPGSANTVGTLRRRGYEDAMRERGLADHIEVETADYTDDGGYRAAVRLLRSAHPPTAIFAVDDVTCLGARAAAAELGVAVPDRLSLVGYDNSTLARLRSIWLTSVDSGGAQLGRLAARTLAARIEDPALDAQVHLLAPALQVRGSSGPVGR